VQMDGAWLQHQPRDTHPVMGYLLHTLPLEAGNQVDGKDHLRQHGSPVCVMRDLLLGDLDIHCNGVYCAFGYLVFMAWAYEMDRACIMIVIVKAIG
jgi:hypothetical protein